MNKIVAHYFGRELLRIFVRRSKHSHKLCMGNRENMMLSDVVLMLYKNLDAVIKRESGDAN